MLHKSIEPPPVSNHGDTVPESTIADVGKLLAAEAAIGAKPHSLAHDGLAKPADELSAQMADISFEDLQVDAATESAAHSAATVCANAGFDVYPVWQQDGVTHEAKAPATAHGYKDATRDQAAIDEWWPHCTNLGVALRTGLVTAGIHAGKHLIVIDVDAAKVEGGPDGLRSIDDWCSGKIDGTPHTLPSTLEATSPSGGRHLFYVSDKPRGCVVNGDLRIDVRGTGGGIIVAPTRIAKADGSTGEYQWAGGKFDPSLIAEADDEVESLLDLVFDRRRTSTGNHADDQPRARYSKPQHVSRGARHGEEVSFATHLQDHRRHRLRCLVNGWVGHFRLADMRGPLRRAGMRMRRKVRCVYRKCWKRNRTKCRALVRLGVGRGQAWQWANSRKAYWRVAGGGILDRALNNTKLQELGWTLFYPQYLLISC